MKRFLCKSPSAFCQVPYNTQDQPSTSATKQPLRRSNHALGCTAASLRSRVHQMPGILSCERRELSHTEVSEVMISPQGSQGLPQSLRWIGYRLQHTRTLWLCN